MASFVQIRVFTRQNRQDPLDFIDWTGYRVEGPPRHHIPRPFVAPRRHSLLRLMALFAVIWVVARLIRGRRSSRWF